MTRAACSSVGATLRTLQRGENRGIRGLEKGTTGSIVTHSLVMSTNREHWRSIGKDSESDLSESEASEHQLLSESDASDLTAEIGKATEWLEQLSNFMTDTSDLTSSSSSDSDSVSQFLLFFLYVCKENGFFMRLPLGLMGSDYSDGPQLPCSCHAVAMQYLALPL